MQFYGKRMSEIARYIWWKKELQWEVDTEAVFIAAWLEINADCEILAPHVFCLYYRAYKTDKF